MTWVNVNNLREHDDLVCDCGSRVTSRGSRNRTLNEGRRVGWVALETETLGGGWLYVHLCPNCVPRRPRADPVERLDGEEPLF